MISGNAPNVYDAYHVATNLGIIHEYLWMSLTHPRRAKTVDMGLLCITSSSSS
jgi:hypothetical protein